MRRLFASVTLAALAAVPAPASASSEPCTPRSLSMGACLDLFCEEICGPQLVTTWCENPKLCPDVR